MKKKQSNRNIEFLFEIGTLRFIQRTWRQFLNPNMQNLAEHHLRVIWIALILAKMENVSNTEKVMKMAIVHDIAESRTGDVNYLQRQYVKRSEDIGIRDILAGTNLEQEFIELWEEYESKKSPEAKIVKDADNLDVDFELQEQKARGYHIAEWDSIRKNVAVNKLFTKSAKKIHKEIQLADPHAWHINGRNRYNSGDWKKLK